MCGGYPKGQGRREPFPSDLQELPPTGIPGVAISASRIALVTARDGVLQEKDPTIFPLGSWGHQSHFALDPASILASSTHLAKVSELDPPRPDPCTGAPERMRPSAICRTISTERFLPCATGGVNKIARWNQYQGPDHFPVRSGAYDGRSRCP